MLKKCKKVIKGTLKVRNFLGIIIFIIVAWGTSCTPDAEEVITENFKALTFSADTVLFDTVFTSVGSITKRLYVQNPNDNAIDINNIFLAGASASSYSIIVNGVAGENFDKQRLLGKDSLLVLVKVNIDPKDESLPFLVKDSIVFSTNGLQQDIKLVAYGQDANFFGNEILACNTVWDSPKPYVITDRILIDTLCTLTIKKGVKIFADKSATILVKGTLKVEGEAENRVLFRNARMDIENAVGQWGGIAFLEGSVDNEINFAVIRNAAIGVLMNTVDNDTIPELVLTNTIIENMSSTGIFSIGSDVLAKNVLIDNCVEHLVDNWAGGYISYQQCTFDNSSALFFRQEPSMVFTDYFVSQDEKYRVDGDLNLELSNCIVWGQMNEELFFDNAGGNELNIFISHSILKTERAFDINNNILNIDPKFIDVRDYDFRLDTLSPAKDKGQELMIMNDLDGNLRDNLPDIGAYERIE